MLNGKLIDVNLRSSLSVQRLEQLNSMATQAAENSGDMSTESYMDDLLIETAAMEDIFEQISEVGTYNGFYENINKAFELLIQHNRSQRPEEVKTVFSNYIQLTTIFRVIEKEKAIINQKWTEAQRILDDLNTIDSEDVERRKGGCNNV